MPAGTNPLRQETANTSQLRKFALALLAIAGWLTLTITITPAAARPNVVIIFIDDMLPTLAKL